MPTYVYKFVKTGETIEVQQSFDDAPLTTAVHPGSGRRMAVKKVFTPVGVTFRGDGFYKTDSRSTSSKSSKSAAPKSDGGGESTGASSTDSSASSASSSAESSASKKSDAKAAATP
jgi:predicted nucleic acid-binding Zn ribbon protein